jgi:hypothetical protein
MGASLDATDKDSGDSVLVDQSEAVSLELSPADRLSIGDWIRSFETALVRYRCASTTACTTTRIMAESADLHLAFEKIRVNGIGAAKTAANSRNLVGVRCDPWLRVSAMCRTVFACLHLLVRPDLPFAGEKLLERRLVADWIPR